MLTLQISNVEREYGGGGGGGGGVPFNTWSQYSGNSLDPEDRPELNVQNALCMGDAQ